MDQIIFELINKESIRQNEGIELIASENYASKNVRKACGSILTNKYAEGYPGARYYGGCEVVDEVEKIAIERACKLFNAKFANVQPHSGSQANAVAYRALLPEGGKILSLVLNDGGHLTHGSKVSFSSHFYDFVHYPLDKDGKLDYDVILQLAKEEKPNLLLAGYSAYPYAIDFKKLKEICDEVNCLFMVDMAHIAGLIAGGQHQNPVDYADVVTSTTHKTLRGPRGGIILTNNEEIAKKIDKVIFPGIQGGPLMHVIAGKAQSFYEALQPEFKDYAKQVIKNIQAMSNEFIKLGYHVISGGTDNHLILLDVKTSCGVTGKEAETLLDKIHITVNKNTIPNETEKATIASGIRIGSPAMTTRGFKEKEFKLVARIIDKALKNKDNEKILEDLSKEVVELTKKFPLNY